MFNRIAVIALAVSATTFTTQTLAADWLVNNMNLQYSNGSGTASAKRALFHVEEQTYDFNDASFDIRWSADQLVIERPVDSFSYSVETSFLKDVLTAQVAGLNFEAVPGKVVFGVTSAALDKVKDDMSLEATSLLCQGDASMQSPVDACVAYTRFTSDGLKTEDVEIKEASIAITAGKLNFAVDLKGVGKIKGEGTAAHDAATKVVTLRVSKVKLSFIDVTGQFFTQLRNMKSDMIRVERPFIYISYGKKEEPTH